MSWSLVYFVGGDLVMKERHGSVGVVTNGVDAVWHSLHVKEVVVQEACLQDCAHDQSRPVPDRLSAQQRPLLSRGHKNSD